MSFNAQHLHLPLTSSDPYYIKYLLQFCTWCSCVIMQSIAVLYWLNRWCRVSTPVSLLIAKQISKLQIRDNTLPQTKNNVTDHSYQSNQTSFCIGPWCSYTAETLRQLFSLVSGKTNTKASLIIQSSSCHPPERINSLSFSTASIQFYIPFGVHLCKVPGLLFASCLLHCLLLPGRLA